MIIGACGFGSTGSSVVSDYLLEYNANNIQVLDNIEFTWVTDPDGLIDLEYHVNHPHNRTSDSIVAIQRYYDLYERKVRHYEKCGGINRKLFKKSTNDFLDGITTVKWNWYRNYEKKGKIKRLIDVSLLQGRIIPSLEKKYGQQIKMYPMEEVRLSVMPENFTILAQKHIRELIVAMGGNLQNTIVLDQPFSGNNPQACFPYFDDPYAVVVDRDPRDNYVFAKTRLLGRNHFMAIENVYDFIKYYRALRDGQPYKKKDERVLSIKFEELVYDYDNATQKLRDFLMLPDNPNPRSIFNPDLSINNTQVWKRFPEYAEDVMIIERELKEYLFDFKQYGDYSPKGEMFFGKSPLHK